MPRLRQRDGRKERQEEKKKWREVRESQSGGQDRRKTMRIEEKEKRSGGQGERMRAYMGIREKRGK